MSGESAAATTAAVADRLIILARPEPGVVLLTLNRPAQRNALSLALIAELSGCIGAVGSSADVAVVVIAANGPAFCAGHDLKELSSHRGDADGDAHSFLTP